MTNTNAPNLALTPNEVSLLRIMYVHGNCATLPELKAEAAKQGIEGRQLDLSMQMMCAQEFIVKQPRPRTAGGYVYSITLKSMKRVRAANSLQRNLDRHKLLTSK